MTCTEQFVHILKMMVKPMSLAAEVVTAVATAFTAVILWRQWSLSQPSLKLTGSAIPLNTTGTVLEWDVAGRVNVINRSSAPNSIVSGSVTYFEPEEKRSVGESIVCTTPFPVSIPPQQTITVEFAGTLVGAGDVPYELTVTLRDQNDKDYTVKVTAPKAEQ